MAMDEHQLFETALAATMNKLDLAFYLKEEQKTPLESFLCKKDVFCCFVDRIRETGEPEPSKCQEVFNAAGVTRNKAVVVKRRGTESRRPCQTVGITVSHGRIW
ncbi:hypothetical protein PO909_023263 [Leuciscus waleckii]